MVDRAEPAESLTAATVWSRGLDNPTYLLSTDQIAAFLRGQSPRAESLLTGRRGAFLVSASLAMGSGDSSQWDIRSDLPHRCFKGGWIFYQAVPSRGYY